MFLKSELVFIYDHNLLTILPGYNPVTPELKAKLLEDAKLKPHFAAGKLNFIHEAKVEAVVEKGVLKPSNLAKLPEYQPGKQAEESF